MSSRFNVIIAGGRDFKDYELLCRKCEYFFTNRSPTCIISGGARGADELGRRYAQEHGFPCHTEYADWETLGKKAGFIRNKKMLETADALIAFWDGQSRGTAHMIQISREKRIPVRVVYYPKNR